MNIKEGIEYNKELDKYIFNFNSDEDNEKVVNLTIEPRKKDKTFISNRKGLSVFIPYKFSNKIDNEIKKDLKLKIKQISFPDIDDRKNLDKMISNSLEILNEKIDFKIDTILIPETSSNLLKEIYKQCLKKFPNSKVISNSFVKNKIDKIKVDNRKISDLDLTNDDDKQLYSMIKNGIKTGKLIMKKISPRFRSLISNYIIVNPKEKSVIENVFGKNVLIIDDYFTTGSTLVEMVNSIRQHYPKDVLCFVLFN